MRVDEAFEPKYNLPIVRERVSYSQLLEDIRDDRVKEIFWFSQRNDFKFEGPCLVEYIDDRIKQSVVPASDMTIPAAMMTHMVPGILLPPVPTDRELDPVSPVAEEIVNCVTKLFPIVSLIVVYYCVQYMNWLKGDMADRKKMKQKELQDARDQDLEDFKDQPEVEARTLAEMGLGVKEIVRELRRQKATFNLLEVKQLVDQARLKEEQEEEEKKTEEEKTPEK